MTADSKEYRPKIGDTVRIKRGKKSPKSLAFREGAVGILREEDEYATRPYDYLVDIFGGPTKYSVYSDEVELLEDNTPINAAVEHIVIKKNDSVVAKFPLSEYRFDFRHNNLSAYVVVWKGNKEHAVYSYPAFDKVEILSE